MAAKVYDSSESLVHEISRNGKGIKSGVEDMTSSWLKILLLTCHQVSSSLMLPPKAAFIHLAPPHHVAIVSAHVIARRRVSILRDITFT